MRRLLAINLTLVLLAPWIAALSGAAVPVVPCPMHRSTGATSNNHATTMAGGRRESAQHPNGSHHGTSARGCNCAGECGRSGAAFSLAVTELIATARDVSSDERFDPVQFELGSAAHFLPLATGPPQRLRI